MRSPLALIEVPNHNPRTGENTREWAVVRTEAAARGLKGYRAVFVREPTPEERTSIMATLAHSAEPDPKVFELHSMLGKASANKLSQILRGET